jgi:transposase
VHPWHRHHWRARSIEPIIVCGALELPASTIRLIAATVTDPKSFQAGRDFAARTATRLNWLQAEAWTISKQGDRYLRRILVVGAHSVLRHAKQNPQHVLLTIMDGKGHITGSLSPLK